MPDFDKGPQKYFGTLCFDEGFGVSVFYSLDRLGEDERLDMLNHNNCDSPVLADSGRGRDNVLERSSQ